MRRNLGKIVVAQILIALLFLFVNIDMTAAADKQRIYDFANVLTETEISELEKVAQEYSEKDEVDYIILTVEDAEKDLLEYMDDFYHEQEFGYNQVHGETAMIGIDIHERKRDVVLAGYNGLEESLSPDRVNLVQKKVIPYLSNGEYYIAFEKFIETSSDYMAYRPGVNPENPFFKTWVQFAIAVVIAAVIVGIMAFNVGTKMTTTPATYRDHDRTKILRRRDRYIRTTVTKRRKPKQSSNGGGGRGGGIGGGIGRTSAGHSRSSSRGKF